MGNNHKPIKHDQEGDYLMMNTFVVVGLLCVGGVSLMAFMASAEPLDQIHWELYKKSFGKVYADPSEEAMRQNVFLETKRKVEQHNAELADELGFEMGYSHLSDWTSDELDHLNGLKADTEHLEQDSDEELPESIRKMLEMDVKDLPDELDWRQVPNRVSSVKDQGNCGSCWAFATVGVLEGQQVKFEANKEMVSLSVQNLIDCDHDDAGCYGGDMRPALNYVAQAHGIDTDLDYPYLERTYSVKHNCTYNPSRALMKQVRGSKQLNVTEESLMKLLSQFGPISIGMCATTNLGYYKSGVLNDPLCDKTAINHAVLLIGYGIDPKQGKYWLVKNSFGEDWGEQGYFRMARNEADLCGITKEPVIPLFN